MSDNCKSQRSDRMMFMLMLSLVLLNELLLLQVATPFAARTSGHCSTDAGSAFRVKNRECRLRWVFAGRCCRCRCDNTVRSASGELPLAYAGGAFRPKRLDD